MPIISPDKKFIAFVELESPHGVPVEFLSIMSVNGKQKKHIDAYNKGGKILRGLGWIS